MNDDAAARKSIEIMWDFMELALAVQSKEELTRFREELAEDPSVPEDLLELVDGHLAWRKLKPEVDAITVRLSLPDEG